MSDIEYLERQKNSQYQGGLTGVTFCSGDEFCSLHLFLAVVPRVEVTPKTVTKMQGSSVKAVCKASGSPSPEIEWNLDLLSTHHEVRRSAMRNFLFKHYGVLDVRKSPSTGVTGPALVWSLRPSGGHFQKGIHRGLFKGPTSDSFSGLYFFILESSGAAVHK